MKDIMFLFFGFLFFTSALTAQDDKAVFDWFPKPGRLPSFLSEMAGEWAVISTEGIFSDTGITGVWEEVLGGRCLMGKFSGPDSVEFLAITGYNNWDKTYFISMFSNQSCAPENLEGIYNDSTRTISYPYYTFKGEEAISIMKFTDPDLITWEFMSPKGEKESELTFTRIK